MLSFSAVGCVGYRKSALEQVGHVQAVDSVGDRDSASGDVA